MKDEDKVRLSDLRVKLGLRIELNHHELVDLLRLQGEEYKESHADAPRIERESSRTSSLVEN
jgi:hypothetical protein